MSTKITYVDPFYNQIISKKSNPLYSRRSYVHFNKINKPLNFLISNAKIGIFIVRCNSANSIGSDASPPGNSPSFGWKKWLLGFLLPLLLPAFKNKVSPSQLLKNEHNNWNNHVYSRDFQSMLEGLDDDEATTCVEESGVGSEKKRRLRVDQVKALEKNFEVDNKLEPERKMKLAQELGLQPRQVAIWFQNRRARWKTKQLERDYNVLKANFDSLKHNYESIQHDNEALLKEINELKSKLQGGNNEIKIAVKEEAFESESDDKETEQSNQCNNSNTELNFDTIIMNPSIIFTDFKDGSSDSDSSAILNEDNAVISSSEAFLIKSGSGSGSGSSSPDSNSSLNCFQFLESNPKSILTNEVDFSSSQYVKLEEHNFFSGEESCSTLLFTDEQAPTLHWYCSEDWN